MRPAPSPRTPASRGHIGVVVAGSLAAGLFFALLLAFAPFIPPQEREVMGAVLCGFAVGWAMLAVLSTRFTDQPQRWAAVPAAFMGLGGVLLLAFGSGVDGVLSWVWPPALLALVIWMVVRARRRLHSPTRRWLLYPVFAILVLASIGGGYEAVRAATATTYSMPGQLIDVGGHRLHLSCTGSGSPTVVLEPGAGAMSSDMGWIAPAVARDTRVCVYDRAGRGWSDPADPPQDGTQIASDLHTLLHRGHEPGPFVLAGHSFGGLYVLNFATRFPDEVAGLVLIDSTAPASAPAPRTSSAGSYEPMSRVSALLSTSARFGLTRLYASLDYGSLPPRSREEVRASVATAENLQSTIDEYVQGSASAKEAAGLEDFGHKPLFVLTAGEGTAAGWMAKQDKLAALSTNSVHRVVDGAAHVDLVMNERPAAATSQAILDVVSSVRSGRPLDR
jgi:pimeloyl-ACP methyl ester carboxylesterase